MMKKFFLSLLAFILVFSLSACHTRYSAPIENIIYIDWHHESDTVQRVSITLSESEQQEILSILNAGKWVDAVINSSADYEFTVNNIKMGYVTGYVTEGYFKDYTNACTLELSEADTKRVNEIFGVKV